MLFNQDQRKQSGDWIDLLHPSPTRQHVSAPCAHCLALPKVALAVMAEALQGIGRVGGEGCWREAGQQRLRRALNVLGVWEQGAR